MFENESREDIKNLYKYLIKIEFQFLSRLNFWITHKKSYGVVDDGSVWIFNTLEGWSEQLGVSKSSIRRAIKSLKDKNFICCKYLSPNKRNRTLYYSINYDKVSEYIANSRNQCVLKRYQSEHMGEHMYIIDNSKQSINKSNKSIKNNFKKNHEQRRDKKYVSGDFSNESEIVAQKPTIIQDMMKIWNEEFATSKIELTKNLARFLVASFKTKFKSCLKEWRKYLKTLKTSAYLMSGKFKLSIWWVIKFITIDRVRAGELGVDKQKIKVDTLEFEKKALEHIELIQESDACKQVRRQISKILSPIVYVSWFANIDLVENHQKIFLKTNNSFVKDYVEQNFMDAIGMEFAL